MEKTAREKYYATTRQQLLPGYSGSAVKSLVRVSEQSAARVWFSLSDDQSLLMLRPLSDRVQHPHGLPPQEFANTTLVPEKKLLKKPHQV